MEATLEKVRQQSGNSLPHIQRPALLLQAIESTLAESSTQPSPTAYFASLHATSAAVLKNQDNEDGQQLLAAVLYLLAIVVPYTPTNVLISQHEALLQNLAAALAASTAEQANLKSLLTIMAHLYSVYSGKMLQRLDCTSLFNSVLPLLADSRPKLRKKAHETVKVVFEVEDHPYAPRTAEWINLALEAGYKDARKNEEAGGRLIGLLAFVSNVVTSWPKEVRLRTFHLCVCMSNTFEPSLTVQTMSIWRSRSLVLSLQHLPDLLTQLLTLPKINNPFLARSAFDVLESLFTRSAHNNLPVPSTFASLLALRPANNAIHTLPSWLAALEHAFVALQMVDPAACQQAFPASFKDALDLCGSQHPPEIRARAEKTVKAFIRWCLPVDNSALMAAIATGKGNLSLVIEALDDALGNLKYTGAGILHILNITTQLVQLLRVRPAGEDQTAAELFLDPHLTKVGAFRANPSFEYRDAAEHVIATMARVTGPEHVLYILPLNLFGEEQQQGPSATGRAWLLPLLKGNITNTSLGHFTSTFLPLSESLFNKAGESAGVEKKIYEALIDQIWALLPGYCDLPVDTQSAYTDTFAQVLGSVMYSQPTLRSAVFRALVVLIESNEKLAKSTAPPASNKEAFRLDQDEAQANLVYLGKKGVNLLSGMFNVYLKNSEGSGYMLDTVSAWMRVLDAKVRPCESSGPRESPLSFSLIGSCAPSTGSGRCPRQDRRHAQLGPCHRSQSQSQAKAQHDADIPCPSRPVGLSEQLIQHRYRHVPAPAGSERATHREPRLDSPKESLQALAQAHRVRSGTIHLNGQGGRFASRVGRQECFRSRQKGSLRSSCCVCRSSLTKAWYPGPHGAAQQVGGHVAQQPAACHPSHPL